MFNKKYENFRRQTHRLIGFDYSSCGFYFITICTKDRIHYFGKIQREKMELSVIGQIAKKFWQNIPWHFPMVQLDKFIVMPNHIHGIITIKSVATHNYASLQECRFANIHLGHHNKFGPQSKNLSSIIRGYKSTVKKMIDDNDLKFYWQSRFYDRIIRNECELNQIRQYILDNPRNWINDRNNI